MPHLPHLLRPANHFSFIPEQRNEIYLAQNNRQYNDFYDTPEKQYQLCDVYVWQLEISMDLPGMPWQCAMQLTTMCNSVNNSGTETMRVFLLYQQFNNYTFN